MYLRNALAQLRALDTELPRSEAAANLSLWDTHQRTQGHPAIPSWQQPAPVRPVPTRPSLWGRLRRSLLG